MEYAKLHDYLVLTHDLDFGNLLRESGDARPSVIQLRTQRVGPEFMGQAVIDALTHLPSIYTESGYLITLDEAKRRVRVLPFRSDV